MRLVSSTGVQPITQSSPNKDRNSRTACLGTPQQQNHVPYSLLSSERWQLLGTQTALTNFKTISSLNMFVIETFIKPFSVLTLYIKVNSCLYCLSHYILGQTPIFSCASSIGYKAQGFSSMHSLPIFSPCYVWHRITSGRAGKCDLIPLDDGLI